ncbi:MAG: hypothetical protein ABI333_20900 [bacterium]
MISWRSRNLGLNLRAFAKGAGSTPTRILAPGRRGFYTADVRRIVIIAGLLSVGVAIVWHADRFDFLSDDAYISFRYAENLARHGELNWNVGERRVEGYTNFLWTVVLAAGIRAGVGPETSSLFLGSLFGVLTALVLFWLCRVLSGACGPGDRGRPWTAELLGGGSELSGWDLLPPALLSCWGAYACWSSGGLETQMFSFLLLLAITQYVREEVLELPFRPSALWFALAAMTRPEGALVFSVVGAHRLLWTLGNLTAHLLRGSSGFRRRIDHSLQSDGLWVLVFLAWYGGYFLWRYEYYGHLYPNTYYIKVATTNAAETKAFGLAYLSSFVRDYKLLWYSPAALLALLSAGLWGWRGARRVVFLWTLVIPVLLVYGWHSVRFGGDFMAMHRFYVPLLPLLALLIGLSCRGAVDLTVGRLLPRSWRFWTFAPLSAVLLTLFAARSTALDRKTLRTLTVRPTGYEGSYDNMESVAFMKKFARDRVLVGRWLRRRVPRRSLMAVGGAGALVYHSGLRAIDSFGLSDLYVAHHTKPVHHRPGHQKRAPLSYVLRRKPDILCYPGLVRVQNWEYQPRPSERRRWDRQGYRYFCANPKGLYPSHYCCLMRTDRPLGLTAVSAYRRAPRR